MRFVSVCSGIEAASVAWSPLGWRAVAFCEIERFASAVLAHHYPDTPNLGDMARAELPDADVLVGGTPCQSFSVAGLRGGMADPRGNLALVYLRLAERMRPRWVVWENVPGVLSSNGGRDFGSFLGGLAQLGYGFAYRVLDAQFFGLAQRRARVFVVGHLGDWRRAAAVLLERSGLCWNPPPRREAREGVAPCLAARSGAGGGLGTDAECGGALVAHALTARKRLDGESETFVTHALDLQQATSPHNRSQPRPVAPVLSQRGDIVAFNPRQDPVHRRDVAEPIGAKDTGLAVSLRSGVRRLTPLECERLQGFPDDYTLIPYRGGLAKDGPRYRALGNSMAVPVMAWIGRRIKEADAYA